MSKKIICGIYKITNNKKGDPMYQKVYIGQSIDINARFIEHNKPSKNEQQIDKDINRLGRENFIYEVIEECSKEDLNKREVYWINYYNSYKDGYNNTLGGQAYTKGRLYNHEEILNDYFNGMTRQQIAKKYNCCVDTVARVLYGQQIIDHSKDKQCCFQIDPNSLALITTYESQAEAAKHFPNGKPNVISEACNGDLKTAYGFLWQKGEYNPNVLKPQRIQGKIPVYKIDLKSSQIIAKYECIQDAAKEINSNNMHAIISGIRRCAHGDRPNAYGYKWEFVNEVDNIKRTSRKKGK